ncbi:Nucleoporin [Lachnellula willkommii]|uniref:mRNA export factor GLE1 n=1 Tax=Lachnellula willkommii TaxID=215461 RepID=A0A559LZ30_9HELO|nr:Nucleoporin [Lachnellula willkommii]
MGDQTSHDDLPSLLRRSHIHQGPAHDYDHDTRFENRNSEDVHRDALAAAHTERERVRAIAIEALSLYELTQEQQQLRQKTEQEEQRVKLEHERAVELVRIRELENKARQIPKPPPRLPTPPPPPVQKPAPIINPPPAAPTPPVQAPPSQPAQHQPQPQTQTQPTPPNPNPNPFATTQPPPASRPAQTPQFQAPAPPRPPQPQNHVTAPTSNATTPSHVYPGVERYLEIHKSLKKLRLFITNAGKADKALKTKTGEMRRAMRQSIGQLTAEKGANKVPLNKIVDILRAALTTHPSPPVDPSTFLISKPEPDDQATHNGDSLPTLFIYLLNVFCKAIITQFIEEAGVAPKAADPVGVIAISVFSNPTFQWRNRPLIDILIAKMRVVCPVLFGIRGSEKTEEGRERLGWKKEGGNWVAEQVHSTRMTGLGAGYAALCLRDFSRTKLKNAWPPIHYWQALASIVSTPPDQSSPTQFIVLRAMVENYEAIFLRFYGTAAIAALKVVLVDFPGRALERNVATSSLKVLADKLERDMGLKLKN